MRLVGRPASLAVLSATALLLAGCAGAPEADGGSGDAGTAAESHFPVEITSCGHNATLEEAPQRAVTLNQGATEVALALGVEDQMVGTAYLDDEIADEYAEPYDQVPVLAKEYPAREKFLAAEPDFAYASYASAFDAEAVGTQSELASSGIESYLSPFGCDDAEMPEPSFEAVWDEITAVGKAFGVPKRAEELVTEQQARLQELAHESAGEGTDVFWYDSGDDTPLAGVGDNGPQLVLDAVGATNVFADLEGGWAEVSWEKVVEADPDVIVLADASWSSAEQKKRRLQRDPVLNTLRAVQEEAYVTVSYSESTPGVRLVDGATAVGQQLAALEDQ